MAMPTCVQGFDLNRIKRIPTKRLTFELTCHFSQHCFALLHFGNACLGETCLIWKSLAKRFAKTFFVLREPTDTSQMTTLAVQRHISSHLV